jgi:hypothetical protein
VINNYKIYLFPTKYYLGYFNIACELQDSDEINMSRQRLLLQLQEYY